MKVAVKSDLLQGMINHPYDSNPEYLAKINFFHFSEDGKLIGSYWEATKGWFTVDYEGYEETITILEGEMVLICDAISYTVKAGDCCVMKEGDFVRFDINQDIKAIVMIYPANKEIREVIDTLIHDTGK